SPRPVGRHTAPKRVNSSSPASAPAAPKPVRISRQPTSHHGSPRTDHVVDKARRGTNRDAAIPPSTQSTTPAPPSTSGTSSTAGSTRTTADSAAAALSRLSLLAAASPDPSAFLIPIYKQAGRRYHVPWQVLAAINEIETSYGRNLNTSSAGAIGWMQFMPDTWRQYAVDAEGKGRPDPYDPRDAIFSAARYLHANGASEDLRTAIV